MQCIRANVDITIIEGGTFDQTFRWLTTVSPLVAVDISGYEGNGAVRAKLTDLAALITLPFQSDAWVADGLSGIYILPNGVDSVDQGKFRIYIRDEDTLGKCANHKDITGVYDVFLENSDGESVFQLYGTATIIAGTTR